MSSVKWIKMTTSMFEDEKINFIESLPDADSILIIWIKLLTQAGKCNSNGFIFLTESIPYTPEMLSNQFRKPINTVKLALKTLTELEMIDMDEEGYLKISNWEKHQNVDGLDKIREQGRKRVAKHRAEQKMLQEIEKDKVNKNDVTGNVTSNTEVTVGNAIDIEVDKERDIDIDKEGEEETGNKIPPSSKIKMTQDLKDKVMNKWNSLNLQAIRSINSDTKREVMLKEILEKYSLEEVLQVIDSINKSSFLQGRNTRNWTISFDWLTKEDNFIKVLEGNYIDSDNKNINTNSNTKTKFHNFKQPTSSKSKEDINDAAERKRIENMQRLKGESYNAD